MKANIRCRFVLPIAVVACAAIFAQGDTTPDANGIVSTIIKAPEIPFKPFGISDLINAKTGKPYLPTDAVKLEFAASLDAGGQAKTFEGTAQQLIGLLNDTESYYNKLGKTLRTSGDFDIFKVISNPDFLLEKQRLANLNLDFINMKDKIRDALSNCQLYKIEHLGINIKTNLPFRAQDRVDLEGEISLTANQLVERFNEQQKLLCNIGYSMFDGITASGNNVISAIMKKRETMMNMLGISKYNKAFSMQAIEKIISAAEIAEQISDIAQSRKVPSIAQIYDLARSSQSVLPPELQIPELPALPSVAMPTRPELKLEKGKYWNVAFGKKNLISTYANAVLELRGSETTQWLKAGGAAGGYVFNTQAELIHAHGTFEASPQKLEARILMTMLGINVFDKTKPANQETVYTASNDYTLNKNLMTVNLPTEATSYKYTFMVGPVPVEVEIGINGLIKLDANVGMTTLGITGGVTPSVESNAYASAAVGTGKFLAIGARGQIVLLEESIPVTGESSLIFKDGAPALKLSINAENVIKTLSGKIYAFAKYPVPVADIPPWTTKESRYEIIKWGGEQTSQKIMNWGMLRSPFGVTTSGDLLDADDTKLQQEQENAVLIEKRRVEVAAAENKIAVEEANAFRGISTDLGSDNNMNIGAIATAVQKSSLQLQAQKAQYLISLKN